MQINLFKRGHYLAKIRPFVDDPELIKVVTGIRRCGKSCLMRTVADELLARSVPSERIVFIGLDARGFRLIKKPDQLEEAIESNLPARTDGLVLFLYR